ncbi:MAG: ExeM/NucH family extracellular endonuclease [Anaerolineae bacterium]|nr:ExeM/NucH family extracellular endonuclease [Anaerolineae bacterium]
MHSRIQHSQIFIGTSRALFALTLLLTAGWLSSSQAWAAFLMEENFSYGATAGSLTTLSGGVWIAHSDAGNNPVQYSPSGLAMAGYGSSGTGGAATISSTGAEDVNRVFGTQSSGTLYYAALVQIASAGSGAYFLHFKDGGTNFAGRLAAKDDGGILRFGVSQNSSTTSYAGSTSFSYATPYLVVMKYDLATRKTDLFVLDSYSATEPATPLISITGPAISSIESIAIRQAGGGPDATIDGIRVATSWAEVVGSSGPAPILSLAKTATPGAVEQGDLVTYTLTLANSGALNDASVFLTDTLPAAVDFAYWITQPAGAVVAAGQLTWNGAVNSAQSVTFAFAVTNLNSSGTVANTAQFRGMQQSGSGSASFTVAGIARIHDVQGNGDTSPAVGSATTVEGIVTADFQSIPSIAGFFVQEEDADADADPATSEGIFVYNSATAVTVGDRVLVTGPVEEYYNQTQFGSGSSVSVVSGGNSMPSVSPVTLPFADAATPERYEGMRVSFAQTLYVTEIYKLGRGGELLLSSSARLMQPTQVSTPGGPAIAMQAANDLNQIVLDDGSLAQNPDPIVYPAPGLTALNTVRGGDTVQNIVGVMGYSWSGWSGTDAYRVHPTTAPTIVHANPRPNSAPDVGGTLRVASFNVLNYFDTFSGCRAGVGGASVACRGAENSTEFTRQRDKIIHAMLTIDADIFGIMEIENDGYANEASAIDDLVDGLNAIAGSGVYAYLNADTRTGRTNVLGTDAIKVGLIYKPGTVTLAGATAVIDSSVDPDFDSSKNRPALAQSFAHAVTGDIVTVVVNHLKSKGSACAGDPDTGDGQGNCNLTREAAAQALVTWLDTDPTGVGVAHALIIGDLNAYAREDPITALETGGYTNVHALFGGTYGYVFDGQWGTLDHALAGPGLLPYVSGTAAWHINADEPIVLDYNTNFKTTGQIASLYDDGPYRASDHDPLLIGINFTRHFTWTGSAGSSWSAGNSWSGGSAPTAADSVYIPAGATPYPVLSGSAAVNQLAVAPGAELTLVDGANLTVETAVNNQGTLRQTRSSVSGATSFLNFSSRRGAPRYYGIAVTPASNLGQTTVTLRGHSQCTTVAGGTIARCFDIAPTNTGVSTTLTFYYQSDELPSGWAYANVRAWHWDGSVWTSAGTFKATGVAGDHYWTQVSGVTGFSPFALRASNAPTDVTVRRVAAQSGATVTWAALSLPVLALIAIRLRRREKPGFPPL